MEVLFLGTGNAFGSGGRHPVSIWVRGERFQLLLDCGPSALPMLKRAGRSASEIDLVLVSHHHGDHFSGLPFLLLDYQYQGPRQRAFAIAGPPSTEEKVEQLTRLLFPSLQDRRRPYVLAYSELAEGEPEPFGPLSVTAFRARHYPQGVAFGYRLSLDGRTVVYSGDTEWTEELARQSEGADLFICECSSFERKIEYHLSYRELENRRHQIRARRTILIHAGEDVLARRSELAFELADDGQEIRL